MKKLLLLIVFAFAVSVQPFGLQTQTADAASSHIHNWSPVYKTVYHDAEYQTKTYWMYMPAFYQGADPTHISFGSNRITPDKTGWYSRYTDYDLLCWYYGSLENVPNEYKVEWINNDTYSNYGLSSSAWNNIAKTGYDGLSIETTDYWGNKCAFNPNLDVLVTINRNASSNATLAYKNQFGVSFYASCDYVDDCFMAVAQEQIKTKDAWTENVLDHYECNGCDDILNCSSSTPYKVGLLANDNTLAGESTAVKFSGKGGSSIINTDKNGCFIVPAELADGTYTVTASADSFVSRQYSVTIKGGELTADPKIKLNLIGDADENGTVGLTDITRIKRHLLNINTLSAYPLNCADANCDGTVDMLDVTAIKRHLIGYSKLGK
ncbi:MAG: hypothetical protein IJ871_04640 [Ruminococcus sp.]|nr:hypothetical protein [Ruminococcus sp.]